MEAGELRIGNWVYIKGIKASIPIWKIKPKGVNRDLTYDKIEPIPITEEWLLKFGFVFNADSKFWVDRLCVHLKDNEFYIIYEQGRVWIEYIHQLQNLFYFLSGKELELKNIN